MGKREKAKPVHTPRFEGKWSTAGGFWAAVPILRHVQEMADVEYDGHEISMPELVGRGIDRRAKTCEDHKLLR